MLGKKVTRSVKKLFRNSFDVSSAETRRDVGVGIETDAERRTLQALVAPWGQGFHMGPPEDITSVTGLIAKIR